VEDPKAASFLEAPSKRAAVWVGFWFLPTGVSGAVLKGVELPLVDGEVAAVENSVAGGRFPLAAIAA
jgi:hypothetical protein